VDSSGKHSSKHKFIGMHSSTITENA